MKRYRYRCIDRDRDKKVRLVDRKRERKQDGKVQMKR
jgi:hypothetical protein